MLDPTKALPPDSRAALALERGRTRRRAVPRRSHGVWAPGADRPDPVATLAASNEGRLPALVPIRMGRMLASPFALLRGSAAIMAADLATTPTIGSMAQLCGDAHLANFGVYASPERRLVFDLNDFDETYRGPWEWDLKRLAASVVVASRENGYPEDTCRDIARAVGREYRQLDPDVRLDARAPGLVRRDPDRAHPRAGRTGTRGGRDPRRPRVLDGGGAAQGPPRRARQAVDQGARWRLPHPRPAPAHRPPAR